MIKFHREDNMAIWLRFDSTGLGGLLDAFSSALNGEFRALEAEVDMSVVTLKRKSPVTRIAVRVQAGTQTEVLRQDDELCWVLTPEDLEVGVERFKQCEAEGCFNPAELMRVQVPKNRKLDYFYCDFAG